MFIVYRLLTKKVRFIICWSRVLHMFVFQWNFCMGLIYSPFSTKLKKQKQKTKNRQKNKKNTFFFPLSVITDETRYCWLMSDESIGSALCHSSALLYSYVPADVESTISLFRNLLFISRSLSSFLYLILSSSGGVLRVLSASASAALVYWRSAIWLLSSTSLPRCASRQRRSTRPQPLVLFFQNVSRCTRIGTPRARTHCVPPYVCSIFSSSALLSFLFEHEPVVLMTTFLLKWRNVLNEHAI